MGSGSRIIPQFRKVAAPCKWWQSVVCCTVFTYDLHDLRYKAMNCSETIRRLRRSHKTETRIYTALFIHWSLEVRLIKLSDFHFTTLFVKHYLKTALSPIKRRWCIALAASTQNWIVGDWHNGARAQRHSSATHFTPVGRPTEWSSDRTALLPIVP